jgi:hypothetical protein
MSIYDLIFWILGPSEGYHIASYLFEGECIASRIDERCLVVPLDAMDSRLMERYRSLKIYVLDFGDLRALQAAIRLQRVIKMDRVAVVKVSR